MSVPFIVLDGVGFLNTSHLICTTLLVIIPSYLDVLSAPTQTKLALVCYWLCTHLSCFSYVTLYRQSKYTVFTNALLQAFAPYCRVAIVRVKSTLAAKDDPLGNGEPTVMQGWKIFEMGSELFLRNFGLPSFRSKNKA